jgi:GWxTD domain-containing protein
MRLRLVSALLATFLALSVTAAVEPGAAIAKAKEQIAAGNHAAALQTLHGASAGAASMMNLKQRSAALAAIHFYSALAALNMSDEDQASAELRSFFFYAPGSKLEASNYPRPFVALFDKVKRDMGSRRSTPASFDDAYPGYPPGVSSSSWPLHIWGSSSEFMILGTPAERSEWEQLADDKARGDFVKRFWLARDPDPATGVNESRIEFLQRIAFADVAFVEAADDRGSLSDRGRVFVLLGPPSRVSIRPLTREEAPYLPHRTLDSGHALEQWTYFRDQLPKALPHNEVVFKFVSDGGSLTRKMQPEFLSEKALKDAPAALRRD